MHSQWPVVRRMVLTVFLLAQASVAQDRAADTQDQGQAKGSSTAKQSSARKARTRKYDSGQSTSRETPTASSASATTPKTELATFGAGCFWHVEETFEHVKGVKNAVSGYSGGNVPYPSYEMVHTGETGHAEVVQVEYDPDVISFEDLLKIFWRCHDPTSINRQGEDEGPQYRSVIFYHSEAQRDAALKSYEQLTGARVFRRPIVTQLIPMQAFFAAEDYHQNYYSGMRRTTTRRRRSATPKAKVVQRRSTSAPRADQNSRAAPAATRGISSPNSPKSSQAQQDSAPSSGELDGSAENRPPHSGG